MASIASSPQLDSLTPQPSKNRSLSPQTKSKTSDDINSSNQSGSPSIKNFSIQNTGSSIYSDENMKDEGSIYFSPVQHKGKTITSKQPTSWGEFSKQEHSTYLDKSASPKLSNSTPPVKNSTLSPRSPFKSPVSTYQSIPNSQASPRKSEKTPVTQTTNGVFDSKPDMSKMKSDMRNASGVISDQKVTFTNEENVPGGPEITVWKDFAESTIQQWGKKYDVGIETLDEMKTNVSPKVSSSNVTPDSQTAANSSTGNSNNNVSEWDKEDERPQYMQMKLNQIPMRHKFSGPKAVNPNDTDDTDDDDDDDNKKKKTHSKQVDNCVNKWQQIHNQSSSRSPQSSHQKPQSSQSRYGKPQKSDNNPPAGSKSPFLFHEPYHNDNSIQDMEVEDLSIYQDSLYLYTCDTIKMCKISAPDDLNKVIFPSLNESFTVAITFHYVTPNTNNRPRLKGIQIYMPDGDSYVVVVEQACFNNQITANSKIATLLTHPKINRIAWRPETAVNDIKAKTGISLGKTVDVCRKSNSIGEAHGQDFTSNLEFYLKDWPALEQFNAEKEKYEKGAGKKFSNIWDREKIPVTVLEYSALMGAALYTLYQHPDLKSVSDKPYFFEDH
ncbi:hypothetical protein K501DRAFT_331984 [Backusella circina FSU 941]|nr:hypothetical protein K501DRAFT_331984 [Backusella circina FSU 941]